MRRCFGVVVATGNQRRLSASHVFTCYFVFLRSGVQYQVCVCVTVFIWFRSATFVRPKHFQLEKKVVREGKRPLGWPWRRWEDNNTQVSREPEVWRTSGSRYETRLSWWIERVNRVYWGAVHCALLQPVSLFIVSDRQPFAKNSDLV